MGPKYGYFWVKIRLLWLDQGQRVFISPGKCLVCWSKYMAKHVWGPFITSSCILLAQMGLKYGYFYVGYATVVFSSVSRTDVKPSGKKLLKMAISWPFLSHQEMAMAKKIPNMNIYWHPWSGPLGNTFGYLEVSFADNPLLSLTKFFRDSSFGKTLLSTIMVV